ncbi:hypothetical protein [Jatrophihabitans endophyticus]|nr:hypothetical protein [Jatrophihabitans endophyticus]
MIHTIQPGDELTMIGPDGQRSERFVLGDLPALRCDYVWIYRMGDAPIVVDRAYGLDATFEFHTRHGASAVNRSW